MRFIEVLLFAYLAIAAFDVAAGEPDHGWIMNANPPYISTRGGTCCGPEHCKVAPSGSYKETPDGFLVPYGPDYNGETKPGFVLLRDPGKGVYDTKDGLVWICKIGGEPVCFFRSPRTG